MAGQLAAWQDRPLEVANLLNPAFCGMLIVVAAEAFRKEAGEELPLSLVFLVLPIVLHRPTRLARPTSTRTRMHTWIERQPSLRIGFPRRARSLVAYTRESLLFALLRNKLTIANNGRVQPRRLGPFTTAADSEAHDCHVFAKQLGVWFGRINDVPTVFSMWGVKP
jgi:hypothetical protein